MKISELYMWNVISAYWTSYVTTNQIDYVKTKHIDEGNKTRVEQVTHTVYNAQGNKEHYNPKGSVVDIET